MAVVCQEIFDDISKPSEEEVQDYAKKIGIDPDSEPQLLPLAEEGLMRALPKGWRPCYDETSKSYYYHNSETGRTQWEHPLDDIYRGLVRKARAESQSLSLGEPTEDATYIRDELPSYEEPPRKETLVRLSPLKAKAPPPSPLRLSPSRRPPMAKQRSEERPASPARIGAMKFGSFDSKRDLDKLRGEAEDAKEKADGELRVAGGGAAFLKSNTKRPATSFASGPQKPLLTSPEAPPRSILRERAPTEPPDAEDDRKSVRFNLEGEGEEEEKPPSRFTVMPVKDGDGGSLRLIKPNPTDFIKPTLKVTRGSDSEEDSVLKMFDRQSKLLKGISESDNSSPEDDDDADPIETAVEAELRHKSERKIERLRHSIWEEKNDELRRFRDDVRESHKKELERVLIAEKAEHEANIKRELEDLRREMENRSRGTLREERRALEAKLDEEARALNDGHVEKRRLLETEAEAKLERRREELASAHASAVAQLRENHAVIIEELKKEFGAEERELRRKHQAAMADLLVEGEKGVGGGGDDRVFERLRCEKRLLEDKYRCLKEKYLKLKGDVKLSIEKRNRRRELSGTATTTTTTTTGSETERSRSINGGVAGGCSKERSSPSPNRRHQRQEKPPTTPKHGRSKPEHRATRQIVIQDLDTSASDRSCGNKNERKESPSQPDSNIFKEKNEDSSESLHAAAAKGRKKLFSRLKASSASRLGSRKGQQRSCSPVENLRRQLQKLEDLEDQFPQNPQADAYHLRYPFTDEKKLAEQGSSELEFFRHRIHLERDSIKRAKEGLRSQKSLFQQRQKELKLKHGSMARHTLQQLCQEEKELTDMEVSLHRTRSLLGEKVIRLRHLEQSLYRATLNNNESATAAAKQEDATLSDISSHSASSGISSTEFATADGAGKALVRGENFQESSEIIQSLENLNSEIREIWEVLHKQQSSGAIATVMPPLPFVYPDLGWPMLAAGGAAVPAPPSIPTLADRLHNYRQHVALANAQSTVVTHAANQGATTTLVERTRSLRHWLRQAGVESAAVEGASPQATL